VDFTSAEFSGGRVEFIGARFSGSQVDFSVARFSGSRVIFGVARFSGGQVDFGGAKFSGSQVDFVDAHFSGSRVDLSDARFAGGEVDFSSTGDWSFPPAFPWTGTPPPGVKLPRRRINPRRSGRASAAACAWASAPSRRARLASLKLTYPQISRQTCG
jgi:hypothetical protein